MSLSAAIVALSTVTAWPPAALHAADDLQPTPDALAAMPLRLAQPVSSSPLPDVSELEWVDRSWDGAVQLGVDRSFWTTRGVDWIGYVAARRPKRDPAPTERIGLLALRVPAGIRWDILGQPFDPVIELGTRLDVGPGDSAFDVIAGVRWTP